MERWKKIIQIVAILRQYSNCRYRYRFYRHRYKLYRHRYKLYRCRYKLYRHRCKLYRYRFYIDIGITIYLTVPSLPFGKTPTSK